MTRWDRTAAERVSVILASAWLIPAPIVAQTRHHAESDPPPVAHSARTDQPPVIDGRIDEAVWDTAPLISDFRQHEPREGAAPTERTEVHILYDRDAVYIGAKMLDRNPAGILTGENRRDANLKDADAVLIVLDTYLDGQNAFVFGTTPAGIEYDGQVTRDGLGGLTSRFRVQAGPGAVGGFNLNWDGSWEVATGVDAQGWYAEFRIPFSTLRYGTGGAQRWGLNISRTIRRRNEEAFWAPIPRNFTLYRVSMAGTLEGIVAPTRRTVRVTPYALSSAHRDFRLTTDTDWDADLGGDAKVGLTPSLNLDLTYNTDFAQVEVDEQQVNLTRFDLFFPEKRPFFLENAGTFSIGTPPVGDNLGLELFYSRRIGIGDDGQPVPILGGTRLTGKVGGVTVGLLDIQTRSVETAGVPNNNYAVGRVLQEFPNRSQLGAMAVSRVSTDGAGDHNLTYAVDGRLGLGEHVNFDGYFARTETPGVSGREHALALNAGYESRGWTLSGQYREVGDQFNPEVGFLPRAGYRSYQLRVERKARVPKWPWLREFLPHVTLWDFFGFDGLNESRFLHIDNTIAFNSGAILSTSLNFRREGLRDPFTIAEGIVLAPETYDYVEFWGRVNSDESAAWSGSALVTAGSFFSGRRRSVVGTLTNRLGTTWVAALRVSYDNVNLPEGNFDTALASLRVAYSFSPRVFLQSLVQYNNQSDDFSANVRFGWLSTAGTGLFLVFNEVRQTITPTGPLDRAFIVKFTRQFTLAR